MILTLTSLIVCALILLLQCVVMLDYDLSQSLEAVHAAARQHSQSGQSLSVSHSHYCQLRPLFPAVTSTCGKAWLPRYTLTRPAIASPRHLDRCAAGDVYTLQYCRSLLCQCPSPVEERTAAATHLTPSSHSPPHSAPILVSRDFSHTALACLLLIFERAGT